MGLVDFDRVMKEYANVEDDFGFSAVSEAEYNAVVNKTAETADDYKTRLAEVEKKDKKDKKKWKGKDGKKNKSCPTGKARVL